MVNASLSWLLLTAAVLVVAWLLPRHGGRVRWKRRRTMQARIRVEDTLKHLLAGEHSNRPATHESVAGILALPVKRVPGLVARMEEAGLLRSHGGGFALTDAGREYAVQVLRAHRLWERYLVDEARYPLTRLHQAADRAEHRLSREELDALEAHLGHPLRDPHGDPIPTAEGEIESLEAVPLTDWPVGVDAEITHLEDEPQAVFEEIIGSGLRTGQVVRIVDQSPEGLRVRHAEHELTLAPVVATNVHVAVVQRPAAPPPGLVPLTDLEDDREAEVVAIDPAIRGFTRRRLMDLGLTPGVTVRAELTPPFGRPRAYRVRECLLALRNEQTDRIWVRVTPGGEG
jgi:DtxR family Mn-dependent transcriptional regulator